MRLPLAQRIVPDTLRKLEAAATRRYAEATILAPSEPLGALYLYGYSIEIRLKAAHYRLSGLGLDADIAAPAPPNTIAPRRIAEDLIRSFSLPSGASPGHDLIGWTHLVIVSRVFAGLTSFTPGFQQTFIGHIQNAALAWTESLRYHANKPYNHELVATANAARFARARCRSRR